jgi:hypothetical protein
VYSQTVGASLKLDRAKYAAPSDDAREFASVLRGDHWPVIEHYRRDRRNPIQITGWDSASSAAHVRAYGNVGIVSGENVGQAQLAPHLSEPWVNIEEDFSPGGSKDFLIAQKAHDIDQTFGPAYAVDDFTPR